MTARPASISLQPGLLYDHAYFDRTAQEGLVAAIRAVVAAAPLFTPTMPRTGKPFSVRMTNCGALGWVSDREGGYRYQATHPATGAPWPTIPAVLVDLWRVVTGDARPPDVCLVNFYAAGARMGLHQDRNENDYSAPVVSISLGAACLFRYGGDARTDRTRSIRLESGDVLAMGGPSRLCFHGVDRLYPGTSTLLPDDARLNLTLRRVRRAA